MCGSGYYETEEDPDFFTCTNCGQLAPRNFKAIQTEYESVIGENEDVLYLDDVFAAY